jgi:hypothetical protein
LRVKVRWESASSFIAEEMSLREELTLECSLLLTGFQNIFQEEDQKSLGIDFGYLDITVRVSVK